MKVINIPDKVVPFSAIEKGECFLYSACGKEMLCIKLNDEYNTDYSAFNISEGFLTHHQDNQMVVPVDVEINVKRVEIFQEV